MSLRTLTDKIKSVPAGSIYDFLKEDAVWLILWLIFGAICCGFTQYDFLWDFTNYHFYNPWYWFDSKGYDIYTPLGSINSFFNPLPDAPLYYMIKWFNNYTTLIYAFQGLWFGGLIFMFHKCALLFFDKEGYRNIILFVLTMAIAITGQATWFQAGASTNETQIAFFAMWGIYLVLRNEKYPELQTGKNYFWAGIVLGVVLGLKQTSVPYAFGLGLTMLILFKNYKKPIDVIGMFILGGFIGCMAIYGFVLYRNYMEYGNPIMPFLNTIFKSEYYDIADFQDRRHIPVNIWEFLYYPYIWESRAAEIQFMDCRSSIFYTISWGFGLYALIYYLRHHRRAPFLESHLNVFTIIYMLIAYILWTLLFSILRYTIPMEMFFAIFIVKTMDVLFFRYYKWWLVLFQMIATQVLLFEFLTVPTHEAWGRTDFLRRNDFLSMEKIYLPENTLVKLYNLPIGVVIPLLAQNNKHFKVVSYVDDCFGMNTDFVERNKFAEIRNKVVAEHKGPVVIFAVGDITAELLRKNEIVHSPDFDGDIEKLREVDKQRYQLRAHHFHYVLDDYNAGYHRMTVAKEDLENLSKVPEGFTASYKPDNNELSKMYCRPLKITLDHKPYVVCVPEELKFQILSNLY